MRIITSKEEESPVYLYLEAIEDSFGSGQSLRAEKESSEGTLLTFYESGMVIVNKTAWKCFGFREEDYDMDK
jgi:hypothetical protein